MRCTKVLLSLNENKHTQNLSQITIQIFENFVDMGLRNENYFDDFLSNLQMNEDIYFLALQCTL
jgi:poly-beta-hydroxyalkanoate depolymerase